MPKHSLVSRSGFSRSLNPPPSRPMPPEPLVLETNQPEPRRKRIYLVRIFYAVFFGAGGLAFAFQSTQLDAVDWALIGVCVLASVLSFVLSTRPRV
ncbi:MAG TPA: hypothetical protein VFV48_06435 [Pseudomonadales bacterium]|nr:hypothetical protein [Pseudomonadales bacterium]